jgi:membrane protease YdiL (CAAX protease family)
MWNRLPTIVRAIITGVIVAIAGTIPWAFLVRLNLDHLPSVPWCIIPAAIYLWFFWKYVNGAGWPRSTAAIRKKNSEGQSTQQRSMGFSHRSRYIGFSIPCNIFRFAKPYGKNATTGCIRTITCSFASLFFILLMSATVAGIVEESAFRGFMQKPIEQHHGPVIAIAVTGIAFGFMHFTHPETTFALMPFYIFVATIYGMLAYITNSILPGMILHAGGNVFAVLTYCFVANQSGSNLLLRNH